MYLLNFKDTDKLSASAAYHQQLAKQSYDLIIEIIQSQKGLFKDEIRVANYSLQRK